MKIRGKKIEAYKGDLIVFPRGLEQLAFRAHPVLSRAEFDRICPEPVPPKKIVRGNKTVPDTDAPSFIEVTNQHNRRFIDWLAITSLHSVSKDENGELVDDPVEWEMVDREDPATWNLWVKELEEAGLSHIERGRLILAINEANGLSDEKLTEARNSFLASTPEALAKSSSQQDDQSATQSGEPANDSA